MSITNWLSPFLGAFFAFCFFVLGKWIEELVKRKKIYKNEHAYLERYFYELKYSIEFNGGILKEIITSYKKGRIELNKLSDLPIREDSSMKIEDKLFINKLETYINNGIKRLNRLQFGITETQNRLNNDLVENDPVKIKRAENSLIEFISESERFLKIYDYYLDVISDLMIENKVILKKYKKWKFNHGEMENEFAERQKEIENEKISSEKDYFNPLIKEQEEKLRKYGLNSEDKKELAKSQSPEKGL
jgi:hypothetical protein